MQVTLPEMGESVTEGTIAKWLKQPGDQVREGEGLVEVTTDKVDAEVPAPASGTLVKILAEAGETVAGGAALADSAVDPGGGRPVKKGPRHPLARRSRGAGQVHGGKPPGADRDELSHRAGRRPRPAAAPAQSERSGGRTSGEDLIHAPDRLRDHARRQRHPVDGGDLRSHRWEPGTRGPRGAPRTRG